MRIRLFTALLAAGLAASALAGCSGGGGQSDDADSGKVVVVQGVDTESGDPANQSATPSLNIGYLQFDPLVLRDSNLEIKPGVATKWKIVDDRTWRFTLREGVKFHDGSALTADDVVYTFTRLLDPKKNFKNRSNVDVIEKAVKVDDHTVDIVTKAPYGPLLARLLEAPIVPKAYIEKVGDEEFARKPIGSGPYKFVRWARDSEYVMEKFDDYWGPKPKNDQVVFKTIAEASARVAALKTGAADIIVNVPPELIPQVDNQPDTKLAPIHGVRTIFVGMNTFVKPLNDPKVRQALNYAIDRKALIKGVLGGRARLTGVAFGPQIHGWDDSIRDSAYEYDPAKAKRLLAEAGYPNGLTLPFEAPRGRYMKDAELAEAIAGQLAKAGVKTKLRISDWGTFWPKTVAKKQQGLFLMGLGNTLLDADYYYKLYFSSEGRGYFHNKTMDKAVAAQQVNLDEASRLEQLKRLHEDVVETAPWVFLWDQDDLYAQRSDLCGWKPRPEERIDVTTAHRCPK